VAFVYHDGGVILVRQLTDPVELSDGAVHAESAIGNDHPISGGHGGFELFLEVGHIVVQISVALRFAEPDAVNYRSVVQFI
jgi:hypothetical protein